jgi:ferritin-like metal-binding protein YciE
MKINNLREMFQIELWYAYDCERKLVEKGLPKMIENCSSPELRQALENHLQETRGHVSKLEQVFSSTGIEVDTKNNAILKEILSAAEDTIDHTDVSPVRDAALIINGNQAEHYEIALYGSLAALARQLGLQNEVRTLEAILTEEKAADAKLTQIAQAGVNTSAARESRAAGV